MNPTLFAVLSVLFYGVGNVLLYQKFAKYGVATTMLGYTAVMFGLSLIVWLVTELNASGSTGSTSNAATTAWAFPSPGVIALFVVLGVVFYLADATFIGGYDAGGDSFSMTSVIIMLPVVTVLMQPLIPLISQLCTSLAEWSWQVDMAEVRRFWQKPDIYQVLAYLLIGSGTLILFARGAKTVWQQ